MTRIWLWKWLLSPGVMRLPCPDFLAKYEFPPGSGILQVLPASRAATILQPHGPTGAMGTASSWRVLSKETFRNGILVGLSVPTLDLPEAALGRTGESGHLSYTIRLMAVLLADKGSKRIRGNYQASSLFPRFNGPSHCNCTCWYQAAPSHPKPRPWAGV